MGCQKHGKRREIRRKFYLDNLIISHLQSASMDAPSLHQPAHCEDRASDAGQPVDFPLSFPQRGLACPYISRPGHADPLCHPSAAINTITKPQTLRIKYIKHGLNYSYCMLLCICMYTLKISVQVNNPNTVLLISMALCKVGIHQLKSPL